MNTESQQPFDREAVRKHRNRAAPTMARYDFLHAEVAERLCDRLDDIKRTFPLALDLGCHGAEVARALGPRTQRRGGIKTLLHCDPAPAMARATRDITKEPCFVADEEFLPVKEAAVDLVLANLSLHWVNDLPGALLQIRRALKPDGLFLGAMFAERTAFELREALMAAELETENGVSPRVSPFVTVQDMGALLQRAGFTLPVVDSDRIEVRYPDMFKLMHDLRGMGETAAANGRKKHPTRRATMMRAAEYYDEKFAAKGAQGDGRIPATFEIVYLTAWAPHPDQPQALQPGSATRSLADFLAKE